MIQVGDSRQEVEHFGLPRADVYSRLDRGDPARPQAYRSGFVALLDLTPVSGEERLELAAVLKLGVVARSGLRWASWPRRPDSQFHRRPARSDSRRAAAARRDLHGDLQPARRSCSIDSSTRSASRRTATGCA